MASNQYPRDLCAVVLAAGEGRRLRPLTVLRPKALCPVGNVPLLDWALRHVAGLGLTGPNLVAVNACWLADQIVSHMNGRVYVSVEVTALGTAGALGNLREWIAGRSVLVANADAYLSGGDLAALLAGWDGETVRLLGVPTRPDDPYRFGAHRFAGYSLLPWEWVARLPAEPAELVRAVWRPAEAAGRLQVVEYPGSYLDAGTPADYLAANLHAAGGANLIAEDAEINAPIDHAVIGAWAVIDGPVSRSVVWPHARVHRDERLVAGIRATNDITVIVG